MRIKIKCILIFVVLVFVFIGSNLTTHTSKNNEPLVKISYTWAVQGFVLDDTGGGDYTWEQVALEDWCSGSGEKDDPYVLEDIYFGGDPLWIRNSEAYFVIRQCLMESYGFAFDNTKNGVFYDNIVEVRVGSPLSISDSSSNILVEGNDITNLGGSSWIGVQIGAGCTNNTIKNNNIHDGFSIGIFLSGWHGIECNSNYLINNTITSSSKGIVLYDCFDNIVKENHLVQNSIGIIVENGAYNNRIVGNNISSNNKGVEITTSANNNEFYWNNITQNSLEGVYIDDTANGNLFFENRFELNSINSFDNNSQNYWNNSKIGNYWDDYIGVDANDDGIGDAPHDVPPLGGSMDYFPIWDDGDDFSPDIAINSPSMNDVFGVIAPDFDLTINDDSPINCTWYTIDDGFNNYTFSGLVGTVNQTAWDNKENESMTLRFYANDSLGNLAFKDVVIWKDLIAPRITITTPTPNQLCGVNSPNFSLDIIEPNVATKLYSINGRPNITFTIEIQLSQSEWNTAGNGTVSITFSVIDKVGNVNSSEVIVRKDANIPNIQIHNPIQDEMFGTTSPSYNISIVEEDLMFMWYVIGGDMTEYPITGFTGTISQEAWDSVNEGDVTITFYAQDRAGNIGSKSVVITKGIPVQPPPSISGYNILVLLGSLSIIVILISKIRDRSN